MKILVLTNLFPPHYLGGYELICEAVTSALRIRGHEVSVLTSDHVRAGVLNNPENKVERSLRIHGLYGHPWLGIGSLWQLECHNNKTLREAIARAKPDLVYVWNMGGLSKSMVFALERLGIPVAFYLSDHWIARGSEADVWSQWWNRGNPSIAHRVLRGLLSISGLRACASRIAATQLLREFPFRCIYFCSGALRDLTVSAGYDVAHGSVIYCPVNIERFHGVARQAAEPIRRFLWVGRLAPDKGIMTALRALKCLGSNFKAVLDVYGAGEPEYVSELTHFVSDHQLPVEFHSAPAREMPNVYRSHDALLFTSEWAEPFALTPLEAMATGLPVVGTTTGGSREIFRHGENALTYTAGNAEELAARILQLSTEPALREHIAVAGQAEVRAKYSECIIVDQIERFLIETIR
ncbi:MAG: hypothetical protein JWM99_2117, partial [Verrucomicrobiales bacterium]|nr:hypothetical protein [Verrucomicrobiales bacterium]